MSRAASFEAVRAKVAAMEAGGAASKAALSFGDPRLDGVFPAHGLPLGCWHDVGGEGLEIETAAAVGGFVAALAAPLADPRATLGATLGGVLIWVMRRGDLYVPGLAAFGLPADRLIQVQARDEAQALGVMEDALGSPGVAAVIGEVGVVDLTAGRRLQLACERRGATGFIIRRRPFGGSPGKPASGAAFGSAAATRWSVACAPSEPAPVGREAVGLGPPRWLVELRRCRGGRPGRWILEMSDSLEMGHGAYPLRVVAHLGDRQLEAPQSHRLAG